MKKIFFASLLAFSSNTFAAQEYVILFARCLEPLIAVAQNVSGEVRFITPADVVEGNDNALFLEDVTSRVDGLVINSDRDCGIPL